MATRVLVTGGAGFIGSHVCDELVEHGYEVRVLDYLVPQVHPTMRFPDYMDKRVELLHGCTTDFGDVLEAVSDVGAVIHLAARVGVGQSAYEIESYVKVNTYGTSILLQVLKNRPLTKLIVASSMSVYGEGAIESNWDAHSAPIPTSEIESVNLESVYALTKYDQEQLCLLFGRAYRVPTIALRFFNVYGPRQSLSNPYTGALAIFASRLMNNKPPVIFEDGQQRRDFVYVTDVARAVRLALESDVSDEVINIGNGRSVTILELAERLAHALGSDIQPVVTGEHRVGDIRHCFADIEKARRLLNYHPEVDLDEGIQRTVAWLRTQTAIDKFDEHHAELADKGLLR